MSRLRSLPGWLLVAVWVLVPVLAAVLLLANFDDDDGLTVQPVDVDVDVQSAQLQRQRETAGIADCPQPTAQEPATDGLPDVALPCLGGAGDVSLAGLRGPLVLNLWAQNCAPCRAELPLLQRLHERRSDITVLGVDVLDTQPDRALDLAEASGVTYPSVADVAGELTEPLRLPGLPVTYFIDADGRIAGSKSGAFTSYEELVATVDEHLGTRS